MLWLVEKGNVEDADSLCAGENAPNSRWSRRRFRRHSHLLFLAPEMQEQLNLTVLTGKFQNVLIITYFKGAKRVFKIRLVVYL